MMRVICLLLVSTFALKVNAQQYTKFNGYGFAADRMRSDSISIHPSDTVRNKSARSIAVLNGVFYIADGTKWKVVGTDTTSLSNRINLKLNIADTSAMLNPYLRKVDTATLSNRINLKLNIADTINKWVTNVYKINDSTIAVLKNGVVSNITINPAATKLVTSVYNNTGSTITRGSVVYISGRHSSNLPTVALAEANNEANSYKTFALVQDDIPTSSSGIVIQAGKIENLNLPTSQYTDGDIVYLSPTVPGGLTIIKPLAPYHICKIGSVTRAHPTQGSIEIKIENGWQLDELSDVQIAAVPLDSTILQFSRVDSLWHDVNPTTAMGNRFVKRTDSASMLSPYLRKADTVTLSNRINLKLNISDTSTMLSPYIRSVGYGLTKSGQSLLADSLLLSTRAWRQKGLDSLAAIELNIADTATMLNPYTRGSGTSGQVAYWNATRSLTGSSGFTFTPTSSLLVNNSVTASGLIARGANLTPTLVAAANNDVLVGLDINPTFTNGAFTGVTNTHIRALGTNSNTSISNGNITITDTRGSTNTPIINFATSTYGSQIIAGNSTYPFAAGANSLNIYHSVSGPIVFYNGSSSPTRRLSILSDGKVIIGSQASSTRIFEINTTGNADGIQINNTAGANATIVLNHTATGGNAWGINSAATGSSQTAGTLAIGNNLLLFSSGNTILGANNSTDAGFRLDVNGTARVQSTLKVGAATTQNASAVLDVESTTRGFLPPRMTTAQRDLIATPAAGLVIYNTSTNTHQGYNGTTWNNFY